jgi:hypothetical protein
MELVVVVIGKVEAIAKPSSQPLDRLNTMPNIATSTSCHHALPNSLSRNYLPPTCLSASINHPPHQQLSIPTTAPAALPLVKNGV